MFTTPALPFEKRIMLSIRPLPAYQSERHEFWELVLERRPCANDHKAVRDLGLLRMRRHSLRRFTAYMCLTKLS